MFNNIGAFFSKVFGKDNDPQSVNPDLETAMEYMSEEDREFLKTNTGFAKNYTSNTVVFCNPRKNICRTIIRNGDILNFPGIEDEEKIMQDFVEGETIPHRIRFGFSIWCCDEEKQKFILSWTIQPDGRYYEDDTGFGAEKQEEIILQACINENGEYEGPFYLYVDE